jgi:hypothetical protein
MKKLLMLPCVALCLAAQPASAQRCPAGADAFQNCLPLDHRYGGPGEISRPQREHAHRTPRNQCKHDYVMRLRPTDPRFQRTPPTDPAAARRTREFISLNREAERACRGVR